MNQQIKHRRLYAFYKSKVLNALMIVVIVSLLMTGYTRELKLPVVSATVALCFFIGYSLWFWIKKPARVIINNWLSDMSALFTLYFLIVAAINSNNPWWYGFPVICAVCILFICMVKPKDAIFEI